MKKQKKTPLRKCVACQELKDKNALIRVVRTPEQEILIDSTGKKSGRGAYVCGDEKCITLAQKKGSLERALKSKVSEEIFTALKQS
ncbi:RNase P modulator RnpM [Mechercharimyces sp. CAU 1602]|uniref:RNase P modulator RnpM n=1 Tax=Mechercharimyces sp. CAU 1602 TaxID=2973933 RepID=UPI00216219F5|nr:YlxR family protein [Mechercharimyces sp. CAU 1602]MCS1351279.1 YlxR family protein [Mechercharimyces sp. CAU 1602]